jgi:hypothetical protein
MTAKPGYDPPFLRDVQLMYIVFDVLMVEGVDLCNLPLKVIRGKPQPSACVHS